MKVLFVCTGNTCRSPMAEALLRDAMTDDVEVKSAGIFANSGDSVNDHAAEVLKEKQIEVDHSSQQITASLLEWADLVLTMTQSHKTMLTVQYPEFKDKIDTYIHFLHKDGQSGDGFVQEDIQDPFGHPISVYRETLSELHHYTKQLKYKLKIGEDKT